MLVESLLALFSSAIMGKTLYVGNLVVSVTAGNLRRLFARYGTVTKARIVTDPIRGTGRSLGFGFVEMADGAEAAIVGLNGTKFNNCILTVNEAQSAESRPREEWSVMPQFLDAVIANPGTKFFRVVDSSAGHPSDWKLEPLKTDLLSDTDSDGLYVMKALNLLPDGSIRECYMDMNLPERISDYAFFPESASLAFGYHYEFPGEIIPAVALDCFGIYQLFYSRKRPEIGIEILRRGLSIARRKHYIAEDLGYILRDERRFREAAEVFKIAVEEGPSSYFIYGELAGAYAELSDAENERKYSALFERAEAGGG